MERLSFALFQYRRMLEAVGASAGIVGALIMSFYPQAELVAWTFWLISSIALLGFAYSANLRWIFGLQIVFTAINFTGILNSLLRLYPIT